jgi:hypothetical protein
MGGVAIKLALTGLMIVGLVAMNLGVDWAAWITAGSLVLLSLLVIFSWLPFGDGDLGDFGGDG